MTPHITKQISGRVRIQVQVYLMPKTLVLSSNLCYGLNTKCSPKGHDLNALFTVGVALFCEVVETGCVSLDGNIWSPVPSLFFASYLD
jgi:hypothetical protein